MDTTMATLFECVKELKGLVRGQSTEIATLTANMDNMVKSYDNLRKDIGKVFDKLDGFNVRITSVENWQDSYDRNENRKIAIMGGVIGMINILVSIILVWGFK